MCLKRGVDRLSVPGDLHGCTIDGSLNSRYHPQMGRPAPQIPLRKFAMHIPIDVLALARAAAKENAMSVSKWTTLALREKLDRRGR